MGNHPLDSTSDHHGGGSSYVLPTVVTGGQSNLSELLAHSDLLHSVGTGSHPCSSLIDRDKDLSLYRQHSSGDTLHRYLRKLAPLPPQGKIPHNRPMPDQILRIKDDVRSLPPNRSGLHSGMGLLR